MNGWSDEHRKKVADARANGSSARDVEEWALATYLAHQVCDKSSGRSEPECWHNLPHDTYFVGNLRNRDDEQESESGLARDPFSEMRDKLAPVAFGADMRLRAPGETVEIETTVEWSAYYRVFPTLKQQRDHQRIRAEEEHQDGSASDASTIGDASAARDKAAVKGTAPMPDADDEEGQSLFEEQEREEERIEQESPDATVSAKDRREDRRADAISRKDDLFPRFRKVGCRAQGLIVLRKRGQEHWEVDCQELQGALKKETERARREVVSDPHNVRTSAASHERLKVLRDNLKDEASYTAFLKSLRNPVEPDWRWEVETEVWQGRGDEFTLTVQLVNVSPGQVAPAQAGSRQGNARAKANPNVEPFLFDTRASFAIRVGELLPFEIDLAPNGFRYDRDMWGRGFNCALEASSGGRQPRMPVPTS